MEILLFQIFGQPHGMQRQGREVVVAWKLTIKREADPVLRTTHYSPLPDSGSSVRIQRGRLVGTCSIITTTPSALCADVHDRMPAILPDEIQKPDAMCDLLKPFNRR
jgi:hypothetical protein